MCALYRCLPASVTTSSILQTSRPSVLRSIPANPIHALHSFLRPRPHITFSSIETHVTYDTYTTYTYNTRTHKTESHKTNLRPSIVVDRFSRGKLFSFSTRSFLAFFFFSPLRYFPIKYERLLPIRDPFLVRRGCFQRKRDSRRRVAFPAFVFILFRSCCGIAATCARFFTFLFFSISFFRHVANAFPARHCRKHRRNEEISRAVLGSTGGVPCLISRIFTTESTGNAVAVSRAIADGATPGKELVKKEGERIRTYLWR